MDWVPFADGIAAATLILGVVTLWRGNIRQKRQATLDVYVQAGEYHRELVHALLDADQDDVQLSDTHDPITGPPLPGTTAYELVQGDSKVRRAIREYLNYWEHVAVGVNRGVYDARTLRELSGTRIRKIFERFTGYIYFQRWKSASAELYVAFEQLALSFGAARPAEAKYRQEWTQQTQKS